MSEELISKYDIRGTEENGLTLDVAWNIGKALADWLTTNGDIVVMYEPMQNDTARAIIEGLRLQGRNVIDGGSGDKEAAKSYISSVGLSGAVVIGYDDADKVIVIELYKEDSSRIEMDSGLKQIRELVLAGNFIPAAIKGELTHLV